MELKVCNLTKQYKEKRAIANVSLELCTGIYGLLGANGAGKSTLMRMICGIQKPTAGEVLFNGKNIRRLGERYRGYLGYLPQQFVYDAEFTALEYLLFNGAVKGVTERRAREHAAQLLREVGLSDQANRKIRTFSGGMKQRLGIAQALMNDPRILVLDEPTAGLDPRERVRFRNLIHSCASDRIVILSTHILSDIVQMAQYVIMMNAGQVIYSGQNLQSLEQRYLEFLEGGENR